MMENLRPIRTIIVDTKSSKKLVRLLGLHPEIEIIGIVSDTKDCIQEIALNKTNLVFLQSDNLKKKDLQEIKTAIDNGLDFPAIVIVSEKPENFIHQKKPSQLYCLAKPISDIDLNQIIKQFHLHRERVGVKTEFTAKHNQKHDCLLFPSITGYKTLQLDEIVYIKKRSENKSGFYVFYSDSNKELLKTNANLKDLYERLKPYAFFQIDRNSIINLRFLNEIEVKTKTCILKRGTIKVELICSNEKLKKLIAEMHCY